MQRSNHLGKVVPDEMLGAVDTKMRPANDLRILLKHTFVLKVIPRFVKHGQTYNECDNMEDLRWDSDENAEIRF